MERSYDLEDLTKVLAGKISEALTKRDFARVASLTQHGVDLEEIRKRIAIIHERISNEGREPKRPDHPEPAQKGSRQLAVEVSQGMINQNLLTLTEHVKRKRIVPGEEMTIKVHPSGELFQTELLAAGNKLRERGAIGRFYREADVRDGDFVVLDETGPQRWKLRKAATGEFRSRQSIMAML